MNPFDQAWALLKMPLVPGSFTREKPYGRNDVGRLTGKFQDPVTGEILDAGAYASDVDIDGNEMTDAYIEDPNKVNEDNFPESRSSMFTIHTPSSGVARPKAVETTPDFRRRGYASAMHDMLAHLHDRAGNKVKRHQIMTDAGSKLWDDSNESWPVREDLQ